jgi:hypothetical protein
MFYLCILFVSQTAVGGPFDPQFHEAVPGSILDSTFSSSDALACGTDADKLDAVDAGTDNVSPQIVEFDNLSTATGNNTETSSAALAVGVEQRVTVLQVQQLGVIDSEGKVVRYSSLN